MGFDNPIVDGRVQADAESGSLEKLSASAFEGCPLRGAQIERSGYEDLFGSPVLDSRLASAPPHFELLGETDEFRQDLQNLDACGNFRKTTTQKDSLEATAQGNSVLNRMYEVAVLTPPGKVLARDFDSVYGQAASAKLQELGITDVSRNGSRVSVNLKNPLHFDGSSGSMDIDRNVSFTAIPSGGSVVLDRVNGVVARSGLFQLAIDRVDLQPREKGYLSGVVKADWSETKVCAFPDGKIYH